MKLIDLINNDFLTAYKAHDEIKTSVLRLIKSALKNREIEKKDELTCEESFKVLKKELKQRVEAAKEYEAAGRAELAAKERTEANIIETYLPADLSENELQTIVSSTLDELKITELKDLGRAVGAVMAKTAGKAEGGTVLALIRKTLSKE